MRTKRSSSGSRSAATVSKGLADTTLSRWLVLVGVICFAVAVFNVDLRFNLLALGLVFVYAAKLA